MPTTILLKRVCLSTSLEAKCYVLNKEIEIDKFGIQKITSIENIVALLKNVDITNIVIIMLCHLKCSICRSAIIQTNYSSQPVACLVNIKSEGGLIHPNRQFFNLICKIESLFSKYCKMADVFELCLSELLEDNILYFPCFEHSEEAIAFTIRYYINMRMRQFSQKHNAEITKNNMIKKKVAKFTKT